MAIAERIPHADIRIFEESAHSILTDEPQALLDVVRGFLTYTPRGQA
jgi:proline iminopeptidase